MFPELFNCAKNRVREQYFNPRIDEVLFRFRGAYLSFYAIIYPKHYIVLLETETSNILILRKHDLTSLGIEFLR